MDLEIRIVKGNAASVTTADGRTIVVDSPVLLDPEDANLRAAVELHPALEVTEADRKPAPKVVVKAEEKSEEAAE